MLLPLVALPFWTGSTKALARKGSTSTSSKAAATASRDDDRAAATTAIPILLAFEGQELSVDEKEIVKGFSHLVFTLKPFCY